MPERIVYWAGDWIPETEAKVSIYDLSVTQGAAAFEMTRSFNGVHFKLQEHLDRLRESCRLLLIPLPDDFERLHAILDELTCRNQPAFRPDDEHRLMLVVSPGAPPMYQGFAGARAGSWLYVADFPLRHTVRGMGRLFTEGVKLVAATAPYQIAEEAIPSEAKHRSRAHFQLAQWEVAPKWALLRNARGMITEGPGFNVAYWNHGWCTPRDNCLQGISMQTVLDLMGGRPLRRPRRLDITRHERRDWPEEIIVTGTPFCVLPVVELDGRVIGDGQPGPWYRATLAAWSEMVGVDIAAQIQRWDAEDGC